MTFTPPYTSTSDKQHTHAFNHDVTRYIPRDHTSVLFVLCPPVGALYEMTGGYRVPFYVSSVVYTLSGFVLYLVLLTKYDKNASTVINEGEVKTSTCSDKDVNVLIVGASRA